MESLLEAISNNLHIIQTTATEKVCNRSGKYDNIINIHRHETRLAASDHRHNQTRLTISICFNDWIILYYMNGARYHSIFICDLLTGNCVSLTPNHLEMNFPVIEELAVRNALID